jgi:hypothetical protein
MGVDRFLRLTLQESTEPDAEKAWRREVAAGTAKLGASEVATTPREEIRDAAIARLRGRRAMEPFRVQPYR